LTHRSYTFESKMNGGSERRSLLPTSNDPTSEKSSFYVGPVHTGGSPGHRYAQFGHHGHKYPYSGPEGRKEAEKKARRQELAALYHGWNGNDDSLSRAFHARHLGGIETESFGRTERGSHRSHSGFHFRSHSDRNGGNVLRNQQRSLETTAYSGTASKVEDPITPTVSCSNCSAIKNNESVGVCGGCRKVFYCNTACQSEHWNAHKKTCGS
jgi:hypothetical protein